MRPVHDGTILRQGSMLQQTEFFVLFFKHENMKQKNKNKNENKENETIE